MPRPLKKVAFADAKNRAWAERFAGQLKAAVKDIGVLLVGGRVSSSLSYGIFVLRGENMPYELAIVRENDGALIYRRSLTMYVSRDAGWLLTTRVGAFSFTISKEQGVYGLVIAGATGLPFKYGISAVGGWMVLVVSRGAVASERTLGETCYAEINQDNNFLSSSRAYVVDADGDGYRDLLLWERKFDSRDPSGKGEDLQECITLKSEAVQLVHFNPDALDFQLQSAVPGKYALHDDLWYPAAWGYEPGQGDLEKPWAGCDDSDIGFQHSDFLTRLCPEDRARFPGDKSFVGSKNTAKNMKAPGK